MPAKKLESNGGVGGIVFGPTGSESAAVLGQRAGIDGEDHEEVVLQERGHDRSLRELNADGDRPPCKALAQPASPLLDCLWAMLEHGGFDLRETWDLETNVMLAVSPVDSYVGG